MKKILFCLMAVLMLAACNNKAGDAGKETDNVEMTENEMTTGSVDGDQGEWLKQTTLMSNKPMVVDFFATWCGPCKELAPILEQIEKKHKDEVIFKRIDVDQEPLMAQEFRIEAVPTLLFITPTGEYQTLLGLESAEVIEAKIAALLTRSAK